MTYKGSFLSLITKVKSLLDKEDFKNLQHWAATIDSLEKGTHVLIPRHNENDLQEGSCRLPNGCTLYWKNEEQGRVFSTDEVGGGCIVWDTATVDPSTLLMAIATENRLQHIELQMVLDREAPTR